jgi:hypothetical protein
LVIEIFSHGVDLDAARGVLVGKFPVEFEAGCLHLLLGLGGFSLRVKGCSRPIASVSFLFEINNLDWGG